MSRPAVFVRRVGADQAEQIVGLIGQYHRERATGEPERGHERVGDVKMLSRALLREDVFTCLAILDGTPVGFVVAIDHSQNPFNQLGSLVVEHIFVANAHRRHGIARSLLAAVTGQAERSGLDQVAVSVPSQGRDLNRFFARLGFTATVVRRVSSTAALRRRLTPSPVGAQAAFEQVLQRRRSARLRATGVASLRHG